MTKSFQIARSEGHRRKWHGRPVLMIMPSTLAKCGSPFGCDSASTFNTRANYFHVFGQRTTCHTVEYYFFRCFLDSQSAALATTRHCGEQDDDNPCLAGFAGPMVSTPSINWYHQHSLSNHWHTRNRLSVDKTTSRWRQQIVIFVALDTGRSIRVLLIDDGH